MFSVLRNEEGQGLVEYGLILFMVALVLVAALSFFSLTINDFFDTIGIAFGKM